MKKFFASPACNVVCILITMLAATFAIVALLVFAEDAFEMPYRGHILCAVWLVLLAIAVIIAACRVYALAFKGWKYEDDFEVGAFSSGSVRSWFKGE